MNEVAPDGAYGLWEHLGLRAAAPALGDLLLVRRPGALDPDLGEFTFKALGEDAAGRTLEPRSTNPVHVSLRIPTGAEVEAVARWIGPIT